jgi:hypothetical protein
MERIMDFRKSLFVFACGVALSVAGRPGIAQHQHDGHAPPPSASSHGAAGADSRVPVRLPDMMRRHTLSNMRDHLQALADIQAAMAKGSFDEASRIAEQNLGMSSLAAHGAHQVAKYMPEGMQAIGTSMHKSASQFATEIQNSAATGDLKPALAALARTTQACVACHAGYRLR